MDPKLQVLGQRFINVMTKRWFPRQGVGEQRYQVYQRFREFVREKFGMEFNMSDPRWEK